MVQLAIAMLLAASLLFLYPSTRPILLFALGRSNNCPLALAMQSEEYSRRRGEVEDRILKASRLVQADERGYHLWQTPKGAFWVPARDDDFLPKTLAEQELEIYGGKANGVRPGDVVLDCGAHVGTYTRQALAAGAKLVVAVEPAPHNLECLRRNLAREISAHSVLVYPKGVWDRDDVLTLHLSPLDSAGDSVAIRYEGGKEGQTVPLTTIDSLVVELALERVDFIKMDIEGAEKKALTGARRTLSRYKPRLAIATEHLPDDPKRIPELIAQLSPGYELHHGPCTDVLNSIRPEVLYFRSAP